MVRSPEAGALLSHFNWTHILAVTLGKVYVNPKVLASHGSLLGACCVPGSLVGTCI